MTKLGIIAGGGMLPQLLAQSCIQQERPYFMLGIEGAVEPASLEPHPHALVRAGAAGKALGILHQQHVSEIVMAGRVARPGLASLKPDATALKLLAKLGGAFFSGDNSLLSALIGLLEEEGFTVRGVDEILQHLLAPKGPMGRVLPNKEAQADIEKGVKLAHAIGELDIGQALVIQQGYVLGVEAAEGTDALIERCGNLRRAAPHGGVLVKIKKPQQERRVDLPTIGLDTIEHAARAGLSGLAVEAGGTLILDRKKVSARADALNMFVIGFSKEVC